MPVYQPNAIVGNSRVLVTLGPKAELMGLFYPHIDFPQNLHEGMPAVFFPGGGGLVWTFDDSWDARQNYASRTNVVETRLRHAREKLRLKITDFVHPSEPALFRRFEAINPTSRPLEATLFQYLDLQLGEVEQKNAVHYHADSSVAVAYWRNICFAIAGDPFHEHGCGRGGTGNSAKLQMERGRLDGMHEEIGDIDLAVGWRLALPPGQRITHDLIITADSDEPAAVGRVEAYRTLGWEALLGWATSRSREHLAAGRRPRVDPDLRAAYYRSLLAIDLLIDPDMGSVLAAPEFDPAFERSGGYGYCWPRDGVEVCLALDVAGYPRYLESFLTWAMGAQREDGYWEQRYWLSGQRGPAWCTHREALQIDQTASVLFAMGRCARRLDDLARPGYLEAIWESARRAADYLAGQIDPDTCLHTAAFDLWETFRGSFTYSNAAIACAMREAAFLAELVGQQALGQRWTEEADRIKGAVMSRLWLGDVFARGLDPDGSLDAAADASALGLIEPFEFLRLDDPHEREIAHTCVEGLVRRLGQRSGEAELLRRFDGDQYAGGGPGALTTIWLARVLLKLALASQDDPQAAAAYRARAVASMRAVLQAGTSTALLPEMMGPGPGGRWAVPHAWTMAGFLLAALTLDELPLSQKRRPTE